MIDNLVRGAQEPVFSPGALHDRYIPKDSDAKTRVCALHLSLVAALHDDRRRTANIADEPELQRQPRPRALWCTRVPTQERQKHITRTKVPHSALIILCLITPITSLR